MKILALNKFHADIIRTVIDGQIKYVIKYKPFINIKCIFGQKGTFSFNIRKIPHNGLFTFSSEKDAETYISNIERPEDKYLISYITIYPKGWTILKKYGTFIISKYSTNFYNVRFEFNDSKKYGNTIFFHDINFLSKLDQYYQYIIEDRHLDIDSDTVRRLTVTTVKSEPLDKIKKVSEKTESLHKELETFYENQNKMMEFINKLNLK
ncbi:MAG: hypothetical protein [Wendovervirus sonii]|uniref:Uncharacterized protein n=1 Tax=phage Lak_Megaphage_Sonny TaxID=3109229 RepID=A0ABZ0Z6T9_9CAUD|nr:MAG: hypothetical protein [phage Lak_Megaphage_Sonny]